MVTGSNQWIHAGSIKWSDFEIDGKAIKKVKEALVIDEHLLWTKHTEEISKKISSAI